tara:strand:+ start:637 stop:1104 length:468 start_codon:yes stop_codon:yes gene_type:complete
MMQNNILKLWASLKDREKRASLILLSGLITIFILSYLINISATISSQKLNLSSAKNNFQYVNSKALNFQQYVLSQKALSKYPEKTDFLFSESERFKLNDFQVDSEELISFISFSSESVINYSEFLESIAQHPDITMSNIVIIPQTQLHKVKVYFL